MFDGKVFKRFFTASRQGRTRHWLQVAAALALLSVLQFAVEAGTTLPNPLNTSDRTGILSTYSTAGGIDRSNPFFQNLGSNGRTCASCHVASDGWTVTPRDLEARFNMSEGSDPVFQPVDGANCPSADVSSFRARRSAYSMLLSKGLFRISVGMPAGANFTIQQILDPHNCPETTTSQPAEYRRPLPSTNLDFISAAMWDGRETVTDPTTGYINLNQSLTNQAADATTGHAQASAPPSSEQLAQIVAFETGLYTAQAYDEDAGDLTAHGATGGPENLSSQAFHIGINDALGGDPSGAQFNSNAFSLFDSWANLKWRPERQAVVRGQTLFNTFPIAITGVAGLNDAEGRPVIYGTCTTCHDSPNIGNHSFSVPLKIGTTDYPPMPALDIAGLPVYTVQCANGTSIQVTDLGRAMKSGQCADVGKVKGPILRGLAGRAPYFHNGSARSLNDAVEFYNQRFNLNLTERQKLDLVAFLKTL